MSETEMDDVWRTVLESRTKLNEVKRRFRNCQQGGPSQDVDEESDDLNATNEAKDASKSLEKDQDFTDELVSVARSRYYVYFLLFYLEQRCLWINFH